MSRLPGVRRGLAAAFAGAALLVASAALPAPALADTPAPASAASPSPEEAGTPQPAPVAVPPAATGEPQPGATATPPTGAVAPSSAPGASESGTGAVPPAAATPPPRETGPTQAAAAPPQNSSLAPEWKALFSLILPGTGQLANGDWVAGAGQVGLYFALLNQYEILINKDDYIQPTDRTDINRNITINRTSFSADLYGQALTDLSFYSAFGAYRDARQAMDNRGYTTPAPHESLGEAAYAPFQWTYLSRPTTFIPLLLALASSAAPPDSSSYLYRPIGGLTREELAEGFALQYEMVAVGEESFFRGVLNNYFSDAFGETWGLVSSSAVFGLAHAGVGTQASGLEAGAFGLYLGWLHQINDYDIRQGVAIHFWWDFLLALGTLQQRQAKTYDRAVRIAQIGFRF